MVDTLVRLGVSSDRLVAKGYGADKPLVPNSTDANRAKNRRVQVIIDRARHVRKDIIFLSHGGPIATPEDAAWINQHTDAVGFVGASSLERLAVEESLAGLTRRFKKIPVRKEALKAIRWR